MLTYLLIDNRIKLSRRYFMENKVINRCPICGDKLVVTSLRCEECETEIKGRFNLSVFDYLSESQQKFVLIFLKNGGNIKLIEKELGISYPTVKKILDEVSAVLGIASPNKETRESVLSKLKNDEISFEEAEALLDNMKGI